MRLAGPSSPFKLELFKIPTTADEITPHVRILASPIDILKFANKILIITPDHLGSALGIWSLRISTDVSIKSGSMEDFLVGIRPLYDAVVILNPAALIWDKISNEAISHVTWKARGGALKLGVSHIQDVKPVQAIPGHDGPAEHIASVFDWVLSLIRVGGKKPMVDFLAVGLPADSVIIYLANHWEEWRTYMHTGCLAESPHLLGELPKNPEIEQSVLKFKKFLRHRVRNYACNNDPRGKWLDEEIHQGCAVFSSEEMLAIVPNCASHILNYFKRGFKIPYDPDTQAEPMVNGIELQDGGNDGKDRLNPIIPEVFGDDLVGGGWKEAWRKLRGLGENAEKGFEVEGMEEVNRMREEEERKVWEMEEVRKRERERVGKQAWVEVGVRREMDEDEEEEAKEEKVKGEPRIVEIED